MDISDDTAAVVAFLQEYSGNHLRKPGDLAIVLELCALRADAHLAQHIITSGASVWSVYRALRRLRRGDDGYRKLEGEFTNQVNEFRLGIATAVAECADEAVLERFQAVYFELTAGALRNVVDFAHDFAYLKQLQNDKRWGTSPSSSDQDQ